MRKNTSGTLAIGARFGHWTVIGPPRKTPRSRTYQLCRCECGTEREVLTDSLKSGNSTNCGCVARQSVSSLNRTHGHCVDGRQSAEYAIWNGMLRRCNNPNHHSYDNYGGRGILVSERWLTFENFFADVGPRPSPLHSLDRIDNDGNYEPGNVRWATATEQRNNTRLNVRYTHRGLSLTIPEWSERTGIARTAIASRLRLGWSIERALDTPVTHKRGLANG